MKVKELLKKYKGYHIIYKASPKSLPYSGLPKLLREEERFDIFYKEFGKLEVKGYDVSRKPFTHTEIYFHVIDGKQKRYTYYDGTLWIYLVSDK